MNKIIISEIWTIRAILNIALFKLNLLFRKRVGALIWTFYEAVSWQTGIVDFPKKLSTWRTTLCYYFWNYSYLIQSHLRAHRDFEKIPKKRTKKLSPPPIWRFSLHFFQSHKIRNTNFYRRFFCNFFYFHGRNNDKTSFKSSVKTGFRGSVKNY